MVVCADARSALAGLEPGSVDLAFWSPPYLVGKSYERDLTLCSWSALLEEVLRLHGRLLKPGGFCVVNVADVMAFPDPSLPRNRARQADHHVHPVTSQTVRAAVDAAPGAPKSVVAEALGCSTQTLDRRLLGHEARGLKPTATTCVFQTGPRLVSWARDVGMYLYDRRIWHKSPAWCSSPWTMNTYRSVSEVEDLYVFHRPGPVDFHRARLEPHAWADWGSRQVWDIPSVRRNDRHPAEFPAELALRVVALFSAPGDLVLDCFLGTGTTAAAAAALGRRYFGAEREPRWASLAAARAAAAASAGWKPGI